MRKMLHTVITTDLCNKVYRQGDSELEAVRPVSLCFESGVHVILGKSGSGKTTFLNMLAGLDMPTSGKIFFNNRDLYESERFTEYTRLHNFGYVFQKYNLIPELSVKDNIMLPIYLRTKAKRKYSEENYAVQFDELISKLDIGEKLTAYPEILSGGEAQRVAIARTIISQPTVIFADEPTGSLDEENSSLVIELLVNLARQSNAILILVTHDSDILKYADRHYIMRDGVIGETGVFDN